MRKILLLVLTVIAFVSVSALARGIGLAGAPQGSVNGTTWHGNAAKAQSGYQFVKTGTLATVEKLSNHQIMGAYECVEIHGGSSAACVFEIHPSAIVCRSSPSGGSLCRLRPHLSENN